VAALPDHPDSVVRFLLFSRLSERRGAGLKRLRINQLDFTSAKGISAE